MSKTCWKCNQTIGFGKKNFSIKDFNSKKLECPSGFTKNDNICGECYPRVAIHSEPTHVDAFDYILKLIDSQKKKDDTKYEFLTRASELRKEKLKFEKETGVTCFLCQKKIGMLGGWDVAWVVDHSHSGAPEGFGLKSRVCLDCGNKMKDEKKKHEKQNRQEEKNNLFNELGTIIKKTPSAQYYGGHNAYLAGGTFGDAQNGELILTEKYLVFTKNAMRESKKWKIVIPLDKVIVGDWKIDEKTRRKSMAGGGVGFGFFGGAGTIHDTGKSHDIVVPYVDENGMDQAPRFGVSSITGNAIREWAKLIYDTLVKIQKEKPSEPTETKTSEEDPLKVLKLRLVKGEITKEEFNELKELLD